MTRTRYLMVLAAGILVAVVAFAPSGPARAQNNDVLIQILTDILGSGLEDAARESEVEAQARYELDEELYRIDEQRARIAEEFDRRRWEINRRYDRQYDRRNDRGRWYNDRYDDDDDDGYRPRRHGRKIEKRRARELARLDEEEAWRMAELDRRQRAAERRYERRVSYDYDYRDYRDRDRYPAGHRYVGAPSDAPNWTPQEIALDREKLDLAR